MRDYKTNRIYNVGVIGAGNVSRMHFEGLKRNQDIVKIKAICDSNENSLNEKSETYEIDQKFSTVNEFINKADVDVVVVCTPSHVREEVLIPLIEAGLPIFCEKPISEDYETAYKISELCTKHGIPIAVNQNFRRYFSFSLAKSLLDRNELVNPIHMSQVVSGFREDVGWRMERTRYLMSVMSNHWFDGYRFMLDDEPETVYCRGIKSKQGQDVAISAILQFKKGTLVSLNESFISSYPSQSALLDCENGSLSLGYKQLEHYQRGEEKVVYRNDYDKPDATFHLLYDLLKSIEEKREPETSIYNNLKSIKIMEAAYKSLETSKPERVGEA